jgi:hypothetical protein
MPFGQSVYGHSFSIDKPLKSISERELCDHVTCAICCDIPDKTMKTDCGHIFCKDCLETYIQTRVAQGDELEFITCPSCNRIINSTEEINRTSNSNALLDFKDNNDVNSRNKGNSGKSGSFHRYSLGRDVLGFEPHTEETWITLSDIDPDFPLTPSSKTTALKSILLKGFLEAPLDKVSVLIETDDLRADSFHRWLFSFNSAPWLALLAVFVKARDGISCI